MLTVGHKIRIGSEVYSSKDHTRLIELRSSASLDVPVNDCHLVLAPLDGLNISPEDRVSVELGYEGDLALVFTGTVNSADWEIGRVILHAVGSFQLLVNARFNRFYERSNATAIVLDVIESFDLSRGRIEFGLMLPSYALGEGESAYDHLKDLAGKCGFDLYADAEDRVVFGSYTPFSMHRFQYGVNILSFALEEGNVPVTGVEVYGESPASRGQGPLAYSWLTKKEVKGKAGDDLGVVKRFSDPTAKTLSATDQIAEAALSAQSAKRRGVMKVLGAPEVKLGDAVLISGMPQRSLNGVYKITGVKHILRKATGYTTTIHWTEA